MTRDDLCMALLEARPGEEWHLDDDGIRWLTPGREPPSQAEIAAAWERVRKRQQQSDTELTDLKAQLAEQTRRIDELLAAIAQAR